MTDMTSIAINFSIERFIKRLKLCYIPSLAICYFSIERFIKRLKPVKGNFKSPLNFSIERFIKRLKLTTESVGYTAILA